jgi:branched-chain amino acid transport system ATP-binding protein
MLEINGLSKSFGGLQALLDIDLNVDQGSVVGIIGPNGAGKTTLFNIISGNYKPDSGSITLKGEEIVGSLPHEICRKGLTRTYQIPRLFSGLTVIENVMVGTWSKAKNLNEARLRAEEVLGFVEFRGKRDVPAKTMMIADSKRIELAKALATEPELLLLDEVMAGLNDVETTEAIAVIRKISKRGVTIILIEHVLRVVMDLCERVVVLDEGRKIAEDTPERIVKNSIVINAYLGEEYL